MTFLPIVGDKDVATREQKIEFLRSHFRYHTMNSWNQSTSYAHCIKIHRLEGLTKEERDKCYDALNCEDAYMDFNNELYAFHLNNPDLLIGTNGRSGGYLVLYRADGDKVFPGKNIDQSDDFEDWDDESLSSRVEEVRRFDEACESAVEAFISFCRTHKFVEKTMMVAQKYISAEEIK